MKGWSGRVWQIIPGLVLALFPGCGRCEASPPEPPPVIPTERAWEFADPGGVRHKIDWQATGRSGVLVFFFDPQSPEGILGLNYLDALSSRARDFGLALVGVEATGRPAAQVGALLHRYTVIYRAPAFPVIADPMFAAAKRFGVQRVPTTVLIGDGGRIFARLPGFDLATAVQTTRLVEQLLRRSEGFFSPALRLFGLSELRERQVSAEIEARAGEQQPGGETLAWGDQLPAFEFTDVAGRVGRWAWSGGTAIRVAFFWRGGSPSAADDLAFLQGLLTQDGQGTIEIIAVEATGVGAKALTEILAGFDRTHPAPSFPVVPDPQRRLAGLFGAGEPLPQTFLVGGNGEVLFRIEGLDARSRLVLREKIDRAAHLAGGDLPQAVGAVSEGATPGSEGTEAPSISRRLERDEALRFNLSQGDYFFSNTQYERAMLYYQRYLELEPASLHALVRLAQIHDLLGAPDRSREYWERVLRVNPDHAEGRARLRQLRRTGR